MDRIRTAAPLPALLVASFASVTLGGCRQKPLTQPQVIATAPGNPEVGLEELQDGVRVTFDRPVAPVGAVGRIIKGPAFRIEPALPGEARWLDPQTLGFFPHGPLHRSTAYEFSLAPDLPLAPGLRLPDWKGMRLVYARLSVEDVAFQGWREHQPPRPLVTVRGSQRLAPETAAAACGFVEKKPGGSEGRRAPAMIAGARPRPDGGAPEERDQDLAAALASGRAVRLEPTEPLASGTSYIFRCGPGLRPQDGGEGLARAHDEVFTTYGPADIKTIEPHGRDIAADGVPIKIEFATPMDPNQVRQRVHLRSPEGTVAALDLSANYRRTVFTWSGDLEPGASYQLVIEKGLVDAFGQRIEDERRHDFRVGDASPRLEAETGIYTVERASGRYPMWTRNLSDVEVRCATVPEARLSAVLTGPANYDAWWDASSRGSVDWKQLGLTRRSQQVRPDAARNRWHDQTLDLASTCGVPAAESVASGVYLLEIVTDEERNREAKAARRERRSLVNVTDLGLLAKVGNASSLVWVVRLSTGAPVAGAAVTIRDLKGRVRFSGTSNADGVVQAPGAAKLTGKRAADAPPAEDGEEGEWEDDRARRVVVTARAGDDLAVLDTNWNNGIQNWNFGVKEDRRLRQQRLRGFLHSDRGLYRPGDTVHLRGIVRALDRMGAMSVPRGGKVHLVIEDPRGATVEESDLAMSAFGGFHRDVALPAEARLGDWRARATLAGTTITERFSVEEYRARTFEVKVKTPRRHDFLGKPLAFEVEANFLYGSPLAGGKLDWNVRRRRYLPRFEGWDEYTFQDFAKLADQGLWWARDEERSFSDGVADGQVTLDPAGRARIATKDVAPGDGPQDYLFEATVTDSSGQAVTSGTALTAHAADLYLGLHPAEMVQAAEMPFAVQVVAFDPQGKRRAASVELTLTRRQYDCGLGKSPSGDAGDWGCRRKDDPKPAVRRTVSVPASGTAAVERVVLAEPGEYVVEVSAKHGRGGRSVASDMVYVVGKGEAFWSGDEGERMTLIASKPRFRPGDVARLVPQTQLGQALALVSLERDGVLSYRLQTMGSSGEAIEIPIDRQLAPNVFASVAMVRGRNGDGDRGRPRFKMGVVNLEVDASQRRLQVSVTPERPAYRPGETVRARVLVASEGTPVRAELAVAAADEGVLQILGYRTPDPLPAFYAPYALGVDSATTWNRLLRAKDPSKVDEDEEEGGDGGGDEAGRVRSRFVATAFWNPAVVTGADGTAQVSFAAPDNLTAFRLMAVAADKGDRFGSGEARFTINKPLQAVPALPRFLSLGDQAQAAVTLHNNEAAAAKVEVALSASGVELAGPASQSIDVPARSHRQAVFAVKATRPGKAAFTFRASGGGQTDAVVVEIPVVQALVRSSELVAEGATSGRIEAPLPPAKGALADRSGLDVVLDRTGLGRVSEGFSYLVGYPYGCLEQTTSKVVPLVALSELMDAGALGGVEQKGAGDRIRGFVRAGIAKILRHQNDDGGFGLWIGADSELHYTAYALWGLEIARRGGYPGEARATEDGVRYLKTRLQAKPPAGGGALEMAGETGTRAFVHHVLAELGQGDPGALGALFERRRELPVYGRAFLLRALVKTERNDQARALAGELLALIPGSTGPAIVKEGAGLDWYWSSDVRTTALVLLALLEGGATAVGSPVHAAIARLTQGLLGARSQGRWSSTQENVYGLTALAALARARGGGAPVKVMVGVGGPGQGRTVTLTGTAIERIHLPLPPPGSGPLVISAAGGEIFYAARMHLERPVSPDALDAGLAVRREYLDPDSGAPLGRLKLGQAVKVRLTLVSPARLAHVAVVDHLPAGLEPVLTRFRRSEMEGRGEQEDRPVWWGPSWKTSWQNQELRDDRAMVFADVLAAGESRHEYLARATTAGRFVMPPATGEAMYRPELHGRTTAGTLVIER